MTPELKDIENNYKSHKEFISSYYPRFMSLVGAGMKKGIKDKNPHLAESQMAKMFILRIAFEAAIRGIEMAQDGNPNAMNPFDALVHAIDKMRSDWKNVPINKEKT